MSCLPHFTLSAHCFPISVEVLFRSPWHPNVHKADVVMFDCCLHCKRNHCKQSLYRSFSAQVGLFTNHDSNGLGGMFDYASIQLCITCCSSDADAITVIVLSVQSFTFLVMQITCIRCSCSHSRWQCPKSFVLSYITGMLYRF